MQHLSPVVTEYCIHLYVKHLVKDSKALGPMKNNYEVIYFLNEGLHVQFENLSLFILLVLVAYFRNLKNSEKG